VKSVSPNEDLGNILQILSENDINQVPVVWENKVVGIVARDNLINFINTRNELQRG
jgi:predicted transcriptional regulator